MLLEPLQGVKCIVGHWSYHLAAAIAMAFVDTSYTNWCKGVCTLGTNTTLHPVKKPAATGTLLEFLADVSV